MHVDIAGRRRTSLVLSAKDGEPRDGCALVISEDASSTSKWHYEVKVRLGDGEVSLGRGSTVPPAGVNFASRVVAIANCPGVYEWVVDVWGNDDDQAGTAFLSVGLPSGAPGLVPLDGQGHAT